MGLLLVLLKLINGGKLLEIALYHILLMVLNYILY